MTPSIAGVSDAIPAANLPPVSSTFMHDSRFFIRGFIWMVFYFLFWLLRNLLVVHYLYRIRSTYRLLYSFFQSVLENIAVQNGTSQAAGEKA